MNEKSKILNQKSKISLESMDIAQEKREQLKALFPEVFSEGKIDFDQLKHVLGEWIEPREERERFGLNWSGKAECMKIIQQPSVATLKPARDESVNFDDTENLFIEGDNLEVLKLLQKSYFGKVKMIYIDPPYNTGKEFIYPDKYTETLDTYLEYTGQNDSNGHKFSTNTETAGRYHSNWLNMMYPRLYLACSLLREDGVIFISIDDNEVAHLRELCDQIFGEENFVGVFVINSTPNARDYGHIGKMHEYCLFYTKDSVSAETYLISEEDKKFKYEDNIGGFNIHPLYNSNVAFNQSNRPNLYYPFYLEPNKNDEGFNLISMEGKEGWITVYPPKSVKEQTQFVWRWGKVKSKENLNKEIVGYTTGSGEYRIVQKMRHSSKLIRSLLVDKKYSSRKGTAEVESLFGNKCFTFPKPLGLLKELLLASTSKDDIILDFFAGSCTTAHAVMALNAEEGGNRKYIMVQLPEPCNEKSEAYKAGYKTIADIGKERIRRAAKKIEKEQNDQLNLNGATKPDLGFKVFKLSPSNFKIWEGNIEKARLDKIENLEQQIFNHVDHIDVASTAEDILYEILLQNGFLLSTQIETIQLAGKEVFSIEDRALLICLDKNLTQEVIDAIVNEKPLQKIIFLDEGFKGNDQLKINTFQTFKARAKEEDSEIVCITV